MISNKELIVFSFGEVSLSYAFETDTNKEEVWFTMNERIGLNSVVFRYLRKMKSRYILEIKGYIGNVRTYERYRKSYIFPEENLL